MIAATSFASPRRTAARIARGAAELAQRLRAAGPLATTLKGPRDVVSAADRQVETWIRAELTAALPTERIVGEELGGEPAGTFWCVDPIDGTANYLRGSPLWGCSVALIVDDEPRVGAIALPDLDLLLEASVGEGVWCQGRPLPPRPPSDVAIVAIGENAFWGPEDIGTLQAHVRTAGWGTASYRCATVGLSFAALGYTDGYLEERTSLWDLAAGVVIAAEAGLEVRLGGPRVNAGMWVQAGTPALLELVDQRR